MDAAVLQEGALIVVDGKGQALTDASSGKPYYTYAHIDMDGGTLYEGNVLIELADDSFSESAGVAINGGLFRGDIEVRSGKVTFRSGGMLDGRLIIAGGKVELLSSEGDAQLDDAEANITGGIEFTAGDLSIESGEGLYMDSDIRIQVGSSINAAGASLGTARTLDMDGGSLTAQHLTANALDMVGGTVDAERLTVAGSTLVSGEGTRLTLNGGSGATSRLNGLVVKNGAEAEIDCLEMESGADVQVGDAADTAGGSTVSFGHLNLNGGMLTVDPAWGLEPSNVAVENLSASHTAADSVTINGSVGVGRNSYLAIGTSDTAWLPGKVEEATGGTGLSDGGVESALGLYKPLTVGSG
ncbi:MAG: hypothetical protein IJD04_00220 [Desulfovibrionaceae bacterium]|nr:hypothetical protein [Desulfovibrionaceae bacterium]